MEMGGYASLVNRAAHDGEEPLLARSLFVQGAASAQSGLALGSANR